MCILTGKNFDRRQTNTKRDRKERKRRKGVKEGLAAPTGEQGGGLTKLYHLMLVYLAEYDVDYTAKYHQSIEDIPGVPNIALNMWTYTASGRRGRAQIEGKYKKVERLWCGQ